MALQDRIRKLSYDDYVLIPDDGKRHEILDGEHHESPAPSPRHQRLVARLFRWLDGFVFPRGLGEVLSERIRHLDEGTKLRRYDELGVEEYWIVNGFRKTVTVYRRIDGAFRRVSELSAAADDILTTPLLPGLAIPLAKLFAA